MTIPGSLQTRGQEEMVSSGINVNSCVHKDGLYYSKNVEKLPWAEKKQQQLHIIFKYMLKMPYQADKEKGKLIKQCRDNWLFIWKNTELLFS